MKVKKLVFSMLFYLVLSITISARTSMKQENNKSQLAAKIDYLAEMKYSNQSKYKPSYLN